MSYPYDELDMMGAGREDQEWTARAVAALARACNAPLRRAQRLQGFLEAFVDEVETYGAAWSWGSSEEEQDDCRYIEHISEQNLRTLAAQHGQLLPYITSPTRDLEVESVISVLTNIQHVDAFFVNGPLWIDRIRALARRIRQRLAKLAGPILAALRLVLARAVAGLSGQSPRASLSQRPPARAAPVGQPRNRHKRRVKRRVSTASRSERGEPHGSPLLALTAA